MGDEIIPPADFHDWMISVNCGDGLMLRRSNFGSFAEGSQADRRDRGKNEKAL